MSKLKWKFILILSLSGPIFGGLTILAWIHGYEQFIALMFLIGVGKFAAYFAPETPKRHAFIAGYLAAFFAVWTQVAFSDVYMKNNPEYLSVDIPFGLDPIAYTVAFSPFGGLMGGFLALLVASLVSALLKRYRSRQPKQQSGEVK